MVSSHVEKLGKLADWFYSLSGLADMTNTVHRTNFTHNTYTNRSQQPQDRLNNKTHSKTLQLIQTARENQNN